MSEHPLDREVEDSPRAESKPGSRPDAVRWIGIVVAGVLVAAVILLHLTGAMGPGAH